MKKGVGKMGFIFCGRHPLLVTRTQVRDPWPMGHLVLDIPRLAFEECLEPSHSELYLVENNRHSILILHLLKQLIFIFCAFQALSTFCLKRLGLQL